MRAVVIVVTVPVALALILAIVGSQLLVNAGVARQAQVELRCSDTVEQAYVDCARQVP